MACNNGNTTCIPIGPAGPAGPPGPSGGSVTSLETLGTSGPSTLSALGVLNIPEYTGGVTSIVAGTNVTISPAGGTGAVTINSASSSRYLGEQFLGGVIYYLYKDLNGVERGLIVNTEEGAGVDWQNTGTVTGADRTEDGVYNTAQMTDSPAATYITGLGTGWYLPSIDELVLLYNNRYSANKALRIIAGADLISTSSRHWSSTESNTTQANVLQFINGSQELFTKTNSAALRGIKAF